MHFNDVLNNIHMVLSGCGIYLVWKMGTRNLGCTWISKADGSPWFGSLLAVLT